MIASKTQQTYASLKSCSCPGTKCAKLPLNTSFGVITTETVHNQVCIYTGGLRHAKQVHKGDAASAAQCQGKSRDSQSGLLHRCAQLCRLCRSCLSEQTRSQIRSDFKSNFKTSTATRAGGDQVRGRAHAGGAVLQVNSHVSAFELSPSPPSPVSVWAPWQRLGDRMLASSCTRPSAASGD